MAMENTPHTDE